MINNMECKDCLQHLALSYLVLDKCSSVLEGSLTTFVKSEYHKTKLQQFLVNTV